MQIPLFIKFLSASGTFRDSFFEQPHLGHWGKEINISVYAVFSVSHAGDEGDESCQYFLEGMSGSMIGAQKGAESLIKKCKFEFISESYRRAGGVYSFHYSYIIVAEVPTGSSIASIQEEMRCRKNYFPQNIVATRTKTGWELAKR